MEALVCMAKHSTSSFRTEALRQSEQALLGQLEQLASLHPRHEGREAQPTAASGSGQPSQQQQPAAPAASTPTQQTSAAATTPAAAQSGPNEGNPPTGAGGTRSPPQPALFRTPAQVPSAGDAARGLAQVLEGNARAGRITSAMFGSAMEAAMAAARQVRALPHPFFILA